MNICERLPELPRTMLTMPSIEHDDHRGEGDEGRDVEDVFHLSSAFGAGAAAFGPHAPYRGNSPVGPWRSPRRARPAACRRRGRASSPDREEGRMRGLSGKRVLVTGGATGIGRAAALRFAEEGASVAVNFIGDPGAGRGAGRGTGGALSRRASTSSRRPTSPTRTRSIRCSPASCRPSAGSISWSAMPASRSSTSRTRC